MCQYCEFLNDAKVCHFCVYGYFLNSEGICVQDCGTGKYGSPFSWRCEDCSEDCAECSVFADNCTSCADKPNMKEVIRGFPKCTTDDCSVIVGPVPYVQNGTFCTPCAGTVCTDSICNGLFLYGQSCREVCDTNDSGLGLYYSEIDGEPSCADCTANCGACEGPGANCTSCINGKFL